MSPCRQCATWQALAVRADGNLRGLARRLHRVREPRTLLAEIDAVKSDIAEVRGLIAACEATHHTQGAMA